MLNATKWNVVRLVSDLLVEASDLFSRRSRRLTQIASQN